MIWRVELNLADFELRHLRAQPPDLTLECNPPASFIGEIRRELMHG